MIVEKIKKIGISVPDDKIAELQDLESMVIPKEDLGKLYIPKSEVESVVKQRVAAAIDEKKKLEVKLSELNRTLGAKEVEISNIKSKFDSLGDIESIKKQLDEFRSAEKKRWDSIKPVIEGSGDNIRGRFRFPEKGKDLSFDDIRWNLEKYYEYENLGILGKGTRFENAPPQSPNTKKKKSPFEGMG